MNKRNGIILGLLFGIIVVEIVVLAPKELGLSPTEEVAAPQPAPRENASGQVMQDVHLVEAKRGGKEWELWADKAVRPADNGEWTIEQVKVKFFAEGGVTYTVTGMKGNVVPNTNDIRIAGKVVTRSSNGYVFKTESVNYDSKSRMLKSPEAVEMSQENREEGGLSLTGADMLANLANNEIKINRNVRARRKVAEGKIATILSERAIFSGRSNLAQFFGNVAIDVDSMRVTGPEAKFAYDPKTQQFESVEVGGGIRVTDTDKFATSSSVSVNFKQDRVVFNGGPRVVQNGDELVGDEIVFLEGGRKVEVSNAKAQFDPRALEKKK
jgi:LPS export ABC transporter protein LptC